MKGADAIVAGTGFERRAGVIRRFCKPGALIYLVRDPGNKYDSNAIAVFIDVKLWFVIRGRVQIGYLKRSAAARWAPRLDNGVAVTAWVKSMYAPPGRDHPRVSIRIDPSP